MCVLFSFLLKKAKVLSSINRNTWKYNVCSIKPEMSVLLLHEIRSRIFK